MKDWVLGRRLMEEQQGNEGGEGGGEPDAGGTPASPGKGGGEPDAGGTPASPGKGGGEPGEERVNALGEEANKPDAGGTPPGKEGEGDPNAPTEEELKAYGEAMKLDEKEFGKEAQLAPAYAERLPAFFKKHGVAPDKVNAMTGDFVRMQKEIEKDAVAREAERHKWLDDLTDKRNKEFYEKFDAPARAQVVEGFKWCFPEKSIFREILSKGPAGMDPDIIRICKFVGERLAKDKTRGAAAGAGEGGGKSISDSFMGL